MKCKKEAHFVLISHNMSRGQEQDTFGAAKSRLTESYGKCTSFLPAQKEETSDITDIVLHIQRRVPQEPIQ